MAQRRRPGDRSEGLISHVGTTPDTGVDDAGETAVRARSAGNAVKRLATAPFELPGGKSDCNTVAHGRN